MSGPEAAAINFDPYQQSAEQLFALLAVEQPTDGEQRFFRANWDGTNPTAIHHVTTMTAAPTGALRQERWGVFNSAQFRLAETSETGETAERFIWCPVPPQRPADPIVLDSETLSRDYGYRELSQRSVLKELTARTNNIDDCISLIAAMRQHGVEPTREFTSLVHKLIYNFAHELRARTSMSQDGDLGQGKVFALLGELQLLSADISDMPAGTQGFLISQLLRTISHNKPSPQTPNVAADNAAAVLDAGFRAGAIPDEPRTTDRVFGSRRIYAYPFATDFVHAKLEADPTYGTSEHIFGVKRVGFAAEYIATMLDRTTGLHTEIENALVNSMLRFPSVAEDHLYFLFDELRYLFASKFGATKVPPQPTSLAEIGPTFAQLLLQATGGKKLGEDEADLNRKSVEIVTAVLNPLLLRKIGKGTLSS